MPEVRVSPTGRKKIRGYTGQRHVATASESIVALYTGQDELKNWDDEELRYGRRRDKDGGLRGKPPALIPKECHHELTRRILSYADGYMRDAVEDAIKQLTLIAHGKADAKKDQIKAIEMLLDRVLGKPEDNVNVKVDTPWMDVLMAGIVSTDEQAGEIIDAEVVDEADDAYADEVEPDEVEWE
jgi:hypothetical protein